jgi:hypothetical protein
MGPDVPLTSTLRIGKIGGARKNRMTWKTFLQRILLLLIAAALLLPVATIVVWGLARLIGAMGDTLGGAVLERIALGFVVAWLLDLVFLVLVQGLHLLISADPPDRP